MMTQKQFATAIETIISNEDTVAEFLVELNQRMPGNTEIELATMYHTNNEFKEWLNKDVWNRMA